MIGEVKGTAVRDKTTKSRLFQIVSWILYRDTKRLPNYEQPILIQLESVVIVFVFLFRADVDCIDCKN